MNCHHPRPVFFLFAFACAVGVLSSVAGAEKPNVLLLLCDHQTDPQENENVAGLPANASVMEQLAEQLRTAREAASSPQVGRRQQRQAKKAKAETNPTPNQP